MSAEVAKDCDVVGPQQLAATCNIQLSARVRKDRDRGTEALPPG